MSGRFHTIAAAGIEATLDLRVGHVRRLTITRDGRTIEPLHVAPWVEDAATGADAAILPNVRWLAGDFFCAPFGPSDLEDGPGHGWPANSAWRHVGTETLGDGTIVRFALERRVCGAELVKELTLRNGHPFLYQRHVFRGGSGAVPVASHAMVRFGPRGGRLAFSPKAWGETPPTPLEPGRHRLAYPARFADPAAAPAADGGVADLTRYPICARMEDFALLVEVPGARLGWAAALRRDAAEVVLSLKNPAELPVTMLWLSDGGRDYVPWNGRHTGVLGIEEGRTWGGAGHRASVGPNPLAAAGVPTSLALDPAGEVVVRHVVGALPVAEGLDAVLAVEIGAGEVAVRFPGGARVAAPWDVGFLA